MERNEAANESTAFNKLVHTVCRIFNLRADEDWHFNQAFRTATADENENTEPENRRLESDGRQPVVNKIYMSDQFLLFCVSIKK